MKSSGILVVLVALFSILIALPLAVLAETQTLTFWDGDGGAYSSTQAAYVNWIGTVNYGSATTLVW